MKEKEGTIGFRTPAEHRLALELAAFAVGLNSGSGNMAELNEERMGLCPPDPGLRVGYADGKIRHTYWDPVGDSAPALKLAVNLHLVITHNDKQVIVSRRPGQGAYLLALDCTEETRLDVTREAIVRLAALIGQAKLQHAPLQSVPYGLLCECVAVRLSHECSAMLDAMSADHAHKVMIRMLAGGKHERMVDASCPLCKGHGRQTWPALESARIFLKGGEAC